MKIFFAPNTKNFWVVWQKTTSAPWRTEPRNYEFTEQLWFMVNGSLYKNPRNHGITNQQNYFNENEKTSYENVNGNENRLEVSGQRTITKTKTKSLSTGRLKGQLYVTKDLFLNLLLKKFFYFCLKERKMINNDTPQNIR